MGKKIVIIDDSSQARQFIIDILAPEDSIQCIEAEDGLDGLEKIESHQDASIIFCDINMPRMSGLELAEEVNADRAKYGNIPLVIVTTEASHQLLRRCKELSISGWITKPVDSTTLMRIVEKYCPSAAS